MYTVGIGAKGHRLSGLLEGNLPAGLREKTVLRPLEALPEGMPPDLIVAAPDWGQGAGDRPCRCLLLPGAVGALTGTASAGWVVSYGLDRRDTLTLSSIGQGRLWAALQREIVTLDGTTVERQELPLPCRTGLPPLLALACVGGQLLLGVPPEEVRVL